MWWRKINIFHIMTECHIHIYLKKKMHLLLQTKKWEFGHFSCANFIAFAGLIKISADKHLCIDTHYIDTYNIVPIWEYRNIYDVWWYISHLIKYLSNLFICLKVSRKFNQRNLCMHVLWNICIFAKGMTITYVIFLHSGN